MVRPAAQAMLLLVWCGLIGAFAIDVGVPTSLLTLAYVGANSQSQQAEDFFFASVRGPGLISYSELEQARANAAAVGTVLGLLVLWKTLYSIWIYISIVRGAGKVARVIKSGSLRLVSAASAPTLIGLVREAAHKQGISGPVRVWRFPSAGGAPCVWQSQSHVELIVPLSALVLARTKPRAVSAILAHEFAHVARRDTVLWPLLQSAHYFLQRRLIPINWSLFALSAVVGVALRVFGVHMGPVIGRVGFVEFLVLAALPEQLFCALLVIARRRSEFHADLVAASIVGDAAVCEALGLLPAEEKPRESRLHPTVNERMANLQRGSRSRRQDDAAT